MQLTSGGAKPELLTNPLKQEFVDQLIDWEALTVTGSRLVFRLKFADPSLISATDGATDTLFVTLNMKQFTTQDGQFIPDGSKIKRNVPAQLSLEAANDIEKVGIFMKVVYLGLMGVNGGLNSVFSECDFNALFDAIEGAQLSSYLPALDFKMPPNINYLFAQI